MRIGLRRRMKRVNLAARILIAGSLALVLYRTSTGATETPAAANATATSSSSPEATASLPYFLMQYVSVPIPGGIRGLAPGTPVMVVTDLGNRLKVKADEIEFEAERKLAQSYLDGHLPKAGHTRMQDGFRRAELVILHRRAPLAAVIVP